jgi:membrane protein DedA with SNARE-associated domain
MTPLVAGITSTVTTAIAQHAVIAVFGLMALDALLPVGGELIMLYAGVLAADAVAGHRVGLLGTTLSPGFETYLVLALAGSLGYLLGALAGWVIGARGGRPLIERRGRWLHLGPERLVRAEAWFERWGSAAVFLGRITPVVRSFISIPAGIFGVKLGRYLWLTLLGSMLWCFAFAGVGWALGGTWQNLHDNFRYVDYAVVAAAVALVVVVVVRARRPRST